MKILVVSPKNKTVFNFRGELIKDMISSGHEVYVTGPNNEYVDDIYSLGVSGFIEVPLVKDNTSVKGDLAYRSYLEQVMKDLNPDLVFAYTIKPVVYGSWAAHRCGISNVCAMVTGRGRVYTSSGLKAKVVKIVTNLLYKKAFAYCRKVIFQNHDDMEFFSGKGYLKSDTAALVNGSGVDMQRFAQSPMPELPTFLMVGRIIKEKGVLDFCKAAQIVNGGQRNARFILLGGYDSSLGALQPEDLAPYVESGLVELPGEVKDPVGYYAECTAFVLPSYYGEGLPRTILEAMACGRPVITTDWPGCREAVKDMISGCLVPIKSPEKLAEKMEFLIDNPEMVQSMGRASYEACKEKYEVSVVNTQMKRLLEY